MKRRAFITLIGGAASWPFVGHAQQLDRVRRIAVVNVIAATDPEAPPRIAVLEMALNNLGWAIGRDLRIDYYWDAGIPARARAIAKQVAATTPDLTVSVTTPPTQVLREEAASVPIVFLQVFDPVSTGLVASLAHPGGNVTGFTNFEPSMASKWAQLLGKLTRILERSR